MGNRLFNVFFNKANNGIAALFVVLGAYFSGNGEAWGDRDTDEIHFSQIGSFSTEKILHIGTAFCVTVTESVNSFH